jgi:ABC-type glycerol-3-phosphate transport system substrate-binding protein
MKNQRILKKALGLGLCLTTMMTVLAGCGKNSQGGGSIVDQAATTNKDYVFKKAIVDFGADYDCTNVIMKGDRVYSTSDTDKGYFTIFNMNYDGSDIKKIQLPEKDNWSHGSLTVDNDGNFYAIFSIYDWSDFEEPETLEETGSDAGEGDADVTGDAGAADGDAAAATDGAAADAAVADGADAVDTDPETPVEEGDGAMGGYADESDDEQRYLCKYDASGNELYRVDLIKDLKDGEDYFYVYGMVYDDEYGLIVSSQRGIQAFDEGSQTFRTILDTTQTTSEFYGRPLSIIQNPQGTIFAHFWGDEGMELRTFDPATGKLSDKYGKFERGDYSFFPGYGYDLYVSTGEGFFGFDLAKDDMTKLLDYADSDLGVSYGISYAVALSENEFLANIPDDEFKYRLTRLTKIAPEDVRDKTIITMAGNYIDYNVRRQVYKFNEESLDYKIKMVDYSNQNDGSDYDTAVQKFNMDVVSGNVPDIMFFSQDDPVDSYINKGLFLDLSTYINNDPDISEGDFVENIFEAFKTGDKVYQVVPSFYVNTIATKKSLMQGADHLTVKECEQMIEGKGVSYNDAFGLVTRDSMLRQGIQAAGSSYIDWEKKSCSFDSQGFIDFLEFVKKFPETIPDDAWEDYNETSYREGKSLFYTTYINNFRVYRRTIDGTFGEETQMVGYPNEMGINCSVIIPSLRLCVSSKTKHADVCWDFLRRLYMPDYQEISQYELPILKSSFDKMAADSMEKMHYTDSDGKEIYEDDIYWVGDQKVIVQPLAQQDVDYMNEFIGSLTNAYNANNSVYNIITEEVAPFFSGQKTAKEVANIIQSRVSIYVNENS